MHMSRYLGASYGSNLNRRGKPSNKRSISALSLEESKINKWRSLRSLSSGKKTKKLRMKLVRITLSSVINEFRNVYDCRMLNKLHACIHEYASF
jgi:hypothetical protein